MIEPNENEMRAARECWRVSNNIRTVEDTAEIIAKFVRPRWSSERPTVPGKVQRRIRVGDEHVIDIGMVELVDGVLHFRISGYEDGIPLLNHSDAYEWSNYVEPLGPEEGA